MQVAVRPHFTAGAAIVGASLVFAATVAPVPDILLPDVHVPAVHMAGIDLAAVVNPLEVYGRVLQDALDNAGMLAENAAPGQVLAQILANQIDSATTLAGALQTVGGSIGTALTTQVPQLVETAVSQLAAGDISGAVNNVLQVPLDVALPAVNLLPALETVLTKPLQNLVNVIQSFTDDLLATELLLSGFIAPLISAPAATALAIQNVVDAAATLNPLAVASEILAAPAVIADGLLNGGYGPDLGPLVSSPFPVKAGGLLSSAELVFNDDGSFFLNTGGPIAAVQQVLQQIADAITPPTPAPAPVPVAQSDVASVPSAGAATFTLPTEDTPASASTETSAAAETRDAAETPDAAGDAVADAATTATAASESGQDTSTSEAESASATKDSTPKSDTADASGEKKSTVKDVDVTTGNKVDPQTSVGSDATKSDDANNSTASHETTTEQTGTTTGTASGGGTENDADSGSKAGAP